MTQPFANPFATNAQPPAPVAPAAPQGAPVAPPSLEDHNSGDYEKTPYLRSGGQRVEAQYVVEIQGAAEMFSSTNEQGKWVGDVCKTSVKVLAATPGAPCMAGQVYQVRASGFNVVDHKDPNQTANARACKQLNGMLAAAVGKTSAELDAAPPGTKTGFQQALLGGQFHGRRMLVTACDATSKPGNLYTKWSYQAYVAPAQ